MTAPATLDLKIIAKKLWVGWMAVDRSVFVNHGEEWILAALEQVARQAAADERERACKAICGECAKDRSKTVIPLWWNKKKQLHYPVQAPGGPRLEYPCPAAAIRANEEKGE